MKDVDAHFVFLNQWGPWCLIVIGITCLPLSNVFYPQYLAFMRRRWSSDGALARLGNLMLGDDWVRHVQTKLANFQITTGKKIFSSSLSVATAAVGAIWLWLRTR